MFETLLNWLDERTGIPTHGKNLIEASTTGGGWFRFFPTIILFTFILQVFTGLFLWAFYCSSAQSAWESVFYVQFMLPGGWLIRGIHHHSAQILVFLLGIHVLFIVVRGTYRPPREFVFWSAIGLSLFSLACCLTGDLLSWTLSGYSATLVRARFLQMLPVIGMPLFKIVAGGPEFGTLTVPRFLVLHIAVFGGGFAALLFLWRYFDYRTPLTPKESDTGTPPDNFCVKHAFACLLVMAVVLLMVYQKPILGTVIPAWGHVDPNLPREASLGAPLGSPADPANFYDAARPEWSFRALYQLSNFEIFAGEKKIIPIFVIPGLLMGYVFLLPFIGRVKVLHWFNVFAVACLFVGFCYLTGASYHHDYFDPAMESYRRDENNARKAAERTIELALAPDGIPPAGILALLANDPKTRGPALYEQHCASCHPFKPFDGEHVHPDFKPISCETPSAPNLYRPIRKEWIAGFLNGKKIRSDDYFGKTKFGNGQMVGYVRGGLKEILDWDEANEELLNQLVEFLAAEAERDAPRSTQNGGYEGITAKQTDLFVVFTCGQCHHTYDTSQKPVIQAPDLRGYLSREWLTGVIADPTSTRFYGPDAGRNKGNDRMPVYYTSPNDNILSWNEIETLADWLRGKWYRHSQSNANNKDWPPTKPPVSGTPDAQTVEPTPSHQHSESLAPLTPLAPSGTSETPPMIPQ